MSIRSEEYKDFSLRIHDKGNRKPILGQFEVTHRCNLSCQHCYLTGGHSGEELTYKELCRIFDEIYREGCLWLCLTGGEPLLRGDFLDIYSYAHKKGFIITLFTNATLFNKEIAAYFRRFPPFCIEVTLNGITKKTYELVSQRKESFEMAIRGIETIRTYGLPLKIKTQMMTLNFDEIPLIKKFCQDLGAQFECSSLIEPRLDGITKPCSLRLPLEKISQTPGQEEGRSGDQSSHKFRDKCLAGEQDESKAPPDNLFRCPGGSWLFYVNPFGELFFCNMLREPSWDLKKGTFKQGFYELFPRIRSVKFKTDSKCRSCSLWSKCLRCPPRAKLECGDQEAPIEHYCQLAQLNAKKEKTGLRRANKPVF